MKTKLLIIIGCLWFLSANSQDIIILRNGDELTGKITEVGISEIKYKKSETSPVYVIGKDKIFMIKYEDGTKDVFTRSEKEEIKEGSDPESIQDICQKGKNDASLNYNARATAGGVIVSTLLFSPVGLLAAIVTSSTPPEDRNLQVPNPKLLNNYNYKACYKSEAHRIKRGKVWGSFAGGLAINLVVWYLVYSYTHSIF